MAYLCSQADGRWKKNDVENVGVNPRSPPSHQPELQVSPLLFVYVDGGDEQIRMYRGRVSIVSLLHQDLDGNAGVVGDEASCYSSSSSQGASQWRDTWEQGGLRP